MSLTAPSLSCGTALRILADAGENLMWQSMFSSQLSEKANDDAIRILAQSSRKVFDSHLAATAVETLPMKGGDIPAAA